MDKKLCELLVFLSVMSHVSILCTPACLCYMPFILYLTKFNACIRACRGPMFCVFRFDFLIFLFWEYMLCLDILYMAFILNMF